MRKLVKHTVIFFCWIGIWQILYVAVGRDVLVASPLDVAQNLAAHLQDSTFYLTISRSVRNIILGFASAMTIGVALAVLTYAVPLARDFFAPFISVMKATPVASFIILALVLMQSRNLPVFVSFLMVTPLVWGNMMEAFCSVDRELLEMSRLFGVSFLSQLKKIYFPASAPYFLAAFQTGFGYAWKSAITAEVMSSPQFTIGRNLADAKVYLDTLELFSWTITVIMLSIFTEKIIVGVLKCILNRAFPRPAKKENPAYDSL